MQTRFIKDFAVALVVILLLAYGIQLYNVNATKNKISDAPQTQTVSDTLKTKIMSIETSIQERKNYVFTSMTDPLKQGNIIRSNFDRAKEFEENVRNTFRYMGMVKESGTNRKLAKFEFQDRSYYGGEGDTVEGRLITSIQESYVNIYYGGPQTLYLQKIPIMPAEVIEQAKNPNEVQNW